MQVIKITRMFSYNGISLNDPNPALSPDAVREFFAMQYPELNNAVIEGPTTKNNVATYKFLRAVGDKGAKVRTDDVRAKVRDLSAGISVGSLSLDLIPAEHDADGHSGRLHRAVSFVHANTRLGRPLGVPPAAFGVWG